MAFHGLLTKLGQSLKDTNFNTSKVKTRGLSSNRKDDENWNILSFQSIDTVTNASSQSSGFQKLYVVIRHSTSTSKRINRTLEIFWTLSVS